MQLYSSRSFWPLSGFEKKLSKSARVPTLTIRVYLAGYIGLHAPQLAVGLSAVSRMSAEGVIVKKQVRLPAFLDKISAFYYQPRSRAQVALTRKGTKAREAKAETSVQSDRAGRNEESSSPAMRLRRHHLQGTPDTMTDRLTVSLLRMCQ